MVKQSNEQVRAQKEFIKRASIEPLTNRYDWPISCLEISETRPFKSLQIISWSKVVHTVSILLDKPWV